MKRRDFITLLGGAVVAPGLAWPRAARAQAPRLVGVLMNGSAAEPGLQANLAAFVQAARALGWNEGQNLRIEGRWNAGNAQLARIYSAQLVGLRPDVIVTASTTNLIAVRMPPTQSRWCSCRSLIRLLKAL